MENSNTYTGSHNPGNDAATGGSFLHHLWAAVASTVVLSLICCGAYPAIVYGLAQTLFPAQANGSLVTKDGTYTTKDQEAVGSRLLGQNFSLPGYFHPRPSAAGNGYDATSSGGSNLGPLSDKLINGVPAASPAPAATAASATSPSSTAPTATAPATQPAPAPAFDGIRLRTIHYAVDNNISFKLYSVRSDGTGNKTEVPLAKYQDAQQNLLDNQLVTDFPHASDTPDRLVVIAGDFVTPIPADAVTASGSGLDPHITPENARLQAARVAAARNLKVDEVKKLIDANTDAPSLGFLGDPGVNVLMLNLALDRQYPLPSAPATSTAPASTTPSGLSK